MLHVHRAERADALLGALGELLTKPLVDPFQAEIVSVPTRGMERWVIQRLSSRLGVSAGRGDGVCANIEFPFPASIVNGAVAVAAGVDPDLDPWAPERAVWPLLAVVQRSIGEAWLARLAEHVGARSDPGDPRRDRRFAAVRVIADLFDRYAVHRPAMVRAWAAGQDLDGSGRPLGDDARWQPQLWRELRDAVGTPSPPERLEAACQALREQPELSALPARLSVFGLTRLPPVFLEVLEALAASRELYLFVLHPSPALWRLVAESNPPGGTVARRAGEPTREFAANRLLAAWGQDSRELQLVLGRARARTEHHLPVARAQDTLLARIQASIVQNRPSEDPGEDARMVLDPGDRSIQVHACHGRARQVEVLRDAILHTLEDDPTLEPRDIIVMCPDVETYAPLIQATFAPGEVEPSENAGAGPSGPAPPDLRVRLADRSLRETNPLLGVVAALLELPRHRLTASEVLDLADREPVRRRFRFDDDDLARIHDWTSASGIRWGLDAEHRTPYRLESVAEGTWRAGLDRLLLGIAMADDGELFGGTLPLDDVGSSEIDLAGRLSEFVTRLGHALDLLSATHSPAGWREAITGSVDALTSVGARSPWQRSELSRVLDDLLLDAVAGDVPDLSLAEVRTLLARRLAGRPTRANFRTGHLTVCTLVPMRSVPHRVVCLLGLDDGAFPRRSPRNGDDLTIADPHVGDRDPRLEDRQMLLDALLAAEDRLIVTYSGADERTNARRPPAVPLGELLDEIDQAAGPARDGKRPRDHVVTEHPLQTFDPRNFKAGELIPEAWSFDRISLEGARALVGERTAAPPFLDGPLEPLAEPIVPLRALADFVQRPVRTFVRRRLTIFLADDDATVEDELPVELGGLPRYGVGEKLLEGVLAGRPLEDCERAERARGTLPPGHLGEVALNDVRPHVGRLARCVQDLRLVDEARSVEVSVHLPQTGRRLRGTVPGVRGDRVVHTTYARLGPRHRIAAWIHLLALTAADPRTPWQANVVAKSPNRDDERAAVMSVAPLADEAGARRDLAVALLAGYVELFDRGMREPLPLACATAAAYTRAVRAGAGSDEGTRSAAEAAAAKHWQSGFKAPGEDGEPDHLLAFGGRLSLAELLAFDPADDEDGPEWFPEEPTRFGRYARRLWGPLLEREVITFC